MEANIAQTYFVPSPPATAFFINSPVPTLPNRTGLQKGNIDTLLKPASLSSSIPPYHLPIGLMPYPLLPTSLIDYLPVTPTTNPPTSSSITGHLIIVISKPLGVLAIPSTLPLNLPSYPLTLSYASLPGFPLSKKATTAINPPLLPTLSLDMCGLMKPTSLAFPEPSPPHTPPPSITFSFSFPMPHLQLPYTHLPPNSPHLSHHPPPHSQHLLPPTTRQPPHPTPALLSVPILPLHLALSPPNQTTQIHLPHPGSTLCAPASNPVSQCPAKFLTSSPQKSPLLTPLPSSKPPSFLIGVLPCKRKLMLYETKGLGHLSPSPPYHQNHRLHLEI